jgi:hypothetical protein
VARVRLLKPHAARSGWGVFTVSLASDCLSSCFCSQLAVSFFIPHPYSRILQQTATISDIAMMADSSGKAARIVGVPMRSLIPY